MKELVHEELTSRIIACAIEVHKALGPGFLESIYEPALTIELRRAGLHVEQQKILLINYRDIPVGEHRLDLLVEGKVIVELKAISALEDIHFAIVRSYLKAAGIEHGLLLNFASAPLTVKRVIFQSRDSTSPSCFPAFLLSLLCLLILIAPAPTRPSAPAPAPPARLSGASAFICGHTN
jgi:GxxExxY protein